MEKTGTKYVITFDQLMDLITVKDTNKRMALIAQITSQKYVEKTFFECAAGGIGSILHTLDELTDEKPKKRTGL